MATQLPPTPLTTPIVEDGSQKGAVRWSMTRPFADWLQAVVSRIQQASPRIATLSLTGQSDDLGLTALVPLASGLYRVSWHLRVSTPASSSSSLTVTITSTEGGATCTQSGAALTTNAITAPQSGSVLVKADANSPISASVAYTSVGTDMAYDVDFVVEQIA
jgi:hypothetical protein